MNTLPYYSADEIKKALPMSAAIEVMRSAFQALHAGAVTMPVRLGMNIPNGLCLFMPAHIAGGGLGQKVVTVFPGNPANGLPTIHAIVLLLDATNGQPKALLEGTYLTALRTGAVTGLATDILANPAAAVLTIFGAGGQATHQIEAVCAVRPIREVRIISRGASAAQLATRLGDADPSRRYVAITIDEAAAYEAAVREADVIVCCTTSRQALFDGAWVKLGAHVNAVGAYTPLMREVDVTLLNRAIVTVDQRAAALHEAGDLLIPIAEGTWSADQIVAELGELAAGSVQFPYDPQRITFFKSDGLAVEDIAAAQAIVDPENWTRKRAKVR
jgi:ornithine cyclodeaminase